jgi:hypothetical protein
MLVRYGLKVMNVAATENLLRGAYSIPCSMPPYHFCSPGKYRLNSAGILADKKGTPSPASDITRIDFE